MVGVIATVASAMWPAFVAAIVVEFAKARSNRARSQGARTPAGRRPIRVKVTLRLRVSLTIRSRRPQIAGDARKESSAGASLGARGAETDA
jgi:hypothetical protein